MKKPYVKPELVIIKPDSPKYEEILAHIKSQPSHSSKEKQ